MFSWITIGMVINPNMKHIKEIIALSFIYRKFKQLC